MGEPTMRRYGTLKPWPEQLLVGSDSCVTCVRRQRPYLRRTFLPVGVALVPDRWSSAGVAGAEQLGESSLQGVRRFDNVLQ